MYAGLTDLPPSPVSPDTANCPNNAFLSFQPDSSSAIQHLVIVPRNPAPIGSTPPDDRVPPAWPAFPPLCPLPQAASKQQAPTTMSDLSPPLCQPFQKTSQNKTLLSIKENSNILSLPNSSIILLKHLCAILEGVLQSTTGKKKN